MAPSLPLDLFVFCVGAVFGSFGNVLIFRVPAGESIGGRSRCPACGRTLSPLELVPVFSFLFLRARCRDCRARISWQYPLVELGSGLLFVYAFTVTFPSVPLTVLLCGCLWLFLLLAVTDTRTGIVPDAFSIPLIIFAIAKGYVLGSSLLLPALLGGGVFALQWMVSHGTWVGSGDILLGTGIGLFLGSIPLTLIALAIAYIAGACAAAILLIRKKKTLESRLAFGPFLVAGALISFVWGEKILMVLFPQ